MHYNTLTDKYEICALDITHALVIQSAIVSLNLTSLLRIDDVPSTAVIKVTKCCHGLRVGRVVVTEQHSAVELQEKPSRKVKECILFCHGQLHCVSPRAVFPTNIDQVPLSTVHTTILFEISCVPESTLQNHKVIRSQYPDGPLEIQVFGDSFGTLDHLLTKMAHLSPGKLLVGHGDVQKDHVVGFCPADFAEEGVHGAQ